MCVGVWSKDISIGHISGAHVFPPVQVSCLFGIVLLLHDDVTFAGIVFIIFINADMDIHHV